MCGFAAQHDVQTGALTLAEAERWALPPGVQRVSYWDWRAAAPVRGADLGAAVFADDWVAGWMRGLERHILPAPATDDAREVLTTAGVELPRWLGNHLSRIPAEGVGGSDAALRSVRRAWPEIAPAGVSRVQTDSVRRLWLGSGANGYQSGRTVGVIEWVARGHAIVQARGVPGLAISWAVAVDQADPRVARFSREELKRRQKSVRTNTLRRLGAAIEGPEELKVERAALTGQPRLERGCRSASKSACEPVAPSWPHPVASSS
jgi:hypothetical protein